MQRFDEAKTKAILDTGPDHFMDCRRSTPLARHSALRESAVRERKRMALPKSDPFFPFSLLMSHNRSVVRLHWLSSAETE
jgi:hypothetical protein